MSVSIDNDSIQFHKQKIVNHIYSSINMLKCKFELLQNFSDLDKLSKTSFFVSPNYSGKNYLLVFMKINESNCSFVIDRKTLSYDKNKIDIKNVFIKNINIEINNEIYKGSIFDGTYITKKSKCLFVITDIYYFKGKDYMNIQLNIKLNTIQDYFDNNLRQTKDINLSMNKIYELSEIDTLVNDIIPADSVENNICGICFYPKTTSTKQIFLFKNNQEPKGENPQQNIQQSTQQNIQQTTQQHTQQNTLHTTSNKIYRYIPKTSDEIRATFEMKNTKMPDVYKFYCIENISKDDKKIMKPRFMGIAYIRNIEKSHWCYSLYTNNTSIMVDCKYNHTHNKWEPHEVNNKKKMPTLLSEIEEYMEIIEETDSE